MDIATLTRAHPLALPAPFMVGITRTKGIHLYTQYRYPLL